MIRCIFLLPQLENVLSILILSKTHGYCVKNSIAAKEKRTLWIAICIVFVMVFLCAKFTLHILNQTNDIAKRLDTYMQTNDPKYQKFVLHLVQQKEEKYRKYQ